MAQISIKMPNDFHAHIRDGDMLGKVLAHSNVFGNVVVMGNLNPPIVTGSDAVRYYDEIKRHGAKFQPIMSIMLVNQATPEIIIDAHEKGVKVLKLIPGGTSTGSNNGVPLKDLKNYFSSLETAEELGMIFSGHWELLADTETNNPIAEIERETRAIPFLAEAINRFPKLKIVVEHVSTSAMVNFVKEAPANVAGTITGHHLGPFYIDDVMSNDEQIINSLLYCKPVLKTKEDIEAVKDVATSGNPKFFFGSDSAPHPPEKKLCPSPAAGIFSAPVVIPHVWSVFVEKNVGAKHFEDFISRFGSAFYGLPTNEDGITLEEERWVVPNDYNGVIPFLSGRELGWKVVF